jgi:Tat protein translocase TatB subunit
VRRLERNRKELQKVVLLILESLGSTELLFILAMALVFFGPRKLPQLSRSLGKSMAEFRRASEDFKRTWDREANLEDLSATTGPTNQPAAGIEENSILAGAAVVQPLQPPMIEAVAPDRVIARQTIQTDDTNPSAVDAEPAPGHSEPLRKRDWL